MKNTKIIQLGIAYAGILVLLTYFVGLFVDVTGDAGKYAAIARNIVESGDWIKLKIHAEPYEQKPQLLLWLSAIGFELGGLHNWTYKLFPLLYSFAGLWFAYQLGKSLYNQRTGQFAAIMLGTSWIYFLYTMDVHTDLVLQANVSLALWQLSEYLKTKKPRNFIWAFIGIGLAMMTKGPVGGAVPAFALGAHLIIKKEYKQLFHPKWIIGIAIALLMCTPAFIGLYKQFGMQGIEFFFITNNFGRITGSYIGVNNDYFFYVHSILYLILPWTVLFVFGFYHEIRSYFKTPQQDREYLTAGGIWIFFLIISVSKGKAPNYVFILVPMMLVIVARWIDHFLAPEYEKVLRRLVRSQLVVMLLVAFLLFLVAEYAFPAKQWVFPIILISSLSFIVYFVLSQQAFEYKLFLPSILVMGTFIFYINAYAMPAAFTYQTSKQASTIYSEKAMPGERLYNYLYPSYEVFFYADNVVSQLYTIEEFQPDTVHASWFYTTEAGKDTLVNRYPQQITEVYPFQNRGMNRISPKFLNPATREASLEPLFLVHLKPD